MYQDSIIEEHWYFFAVAGLNISQKLLEAFAADKFDDFIHKNFELFEKYHALNEEDINYPTDLNLTDS